MGKQIYLLVTILALASCAEGGRPHHRGGPGGEAMGMGGPQGGFLGRAARTTASADADAVLFASFDRDGDLLISTAEVTAGIAREFARADADHDRIVSPQEYQAWSVRALGCAYAPYRLDIDRNADGQITFAEFSTELTARAHRYDSNGDGVIEHADLVHPASSGDDIQLLTPQSDAGGSQNGPPRRR